MVAHPKLVLLSAPASSRGQKTRAPISFFSRLLRASSYYAVNLLRQRRLSNLFFSHSRAGFARLRLAYRGEAEQKIAEIKIHARDF
jgi:hypothetical protein